MLHNGAVLGIAAGEIPDGAVFQHPDPLSELLDKVTVVADEQQHTLKFLDRRFYPFSGSNIQMVGRFIQNQQIDLLIHQHTQPQPALLAAGEGSHSLEHILTLEHKRTQTVTGDLRGAVFLIEHGIIKCPFGVREMDDLGQISPLHGGTELDLTLTILITQQTFDEGGLACTVIAQQRDPLTTLNVEVNTGEQGAVAESLTHILHFEHHVAGEVLFTERCPHGLFFLGFLCFLDALHAVLDGHGTAVERPVVDAPAFHPLQGKSQLLQLCLFLLILFHLQVKTGLLLVHIERVVAGIKLSVTVHDLNDPVSHPVDKITVMGNGQNRTLECVDVAFQPFHTVQAQVVGGLVQQQNVRLFQQEPGQIHPGLLTAGKAVKLLCPLLRSNAQAVANLVHIHIHLISAAGLKAVGKIVVFAQLLCGRAAFHRPLQDFHLGLDPHQILIGREQHILHGIAYGELGNLGNQADAFGRIDIDFTVIVVHFSGEDLEQRGFSAAVPAQNGNALPFLDLERQAFQEVFTDDEEFC